MTIRTREEVDNLVDRLMQPDLPRAERLLCLRELVQSEADIPDELMDTALRRLMERINE